MVVIFVIRKRLSRTEVADLVASAPFLLRYSLKNRLIPALDFLKRVVLLDKRGVFALMLRPRFFWIHVDKNAIPNVALLRELGVPQSCISLLFGEEDHSQMFRHQGSVVEWLDKEGKRFGVGACWVGHCIVLIALNFPVTTQKETMVLIMNGPSDISGPEEHRPVILPPTRAGGIRCFVKPAWRCALHSRKREPQAFA
ncbi:hypothetical protein HYC85_032207 [Camellia sinensis]|uniref:Uncharacterized protein n=1 Tax=Camellia sinensis TaxID=4442 RepID=A0A7J7FWN7_CAMSI|nr:hypothetical protein HYC85_032207 [Camellia sinensis]